MNRLLFLLWPFLADSAESSHDDEGLMPRFANNGLNTFLAMIRVVQAGK